MADTSWREMLELSPAAVPAEITSATRHLPKDGLPENLSHDLLTTGPAAGPPTESPLRHPLPSLGGRGAWACGERASWAKALLAQERALSPRICVTA